MLTLETLRKYADAIYDNFTELDRRMVALETAERRKTVRRVRPCNKQSMPCLHDYKPGTGKCRLCGHQLTDSDR
jgi:hypothetical protein